MTHHRSPDVQGTKRQLGRALNRFADVPSEQLDPAILAAAQSVQLGWGRIVSILATAFCLVGAILSAKLFQALFPETTRLSSTVVSAVVGGTVAALLFLATQGIERQTILRKLKLFLNTR